MVEDVVSKKNLHASIQPEQSDAFIIAVPTPFMVDTEENLPQPDLSYIFSAADEIAPYIKKGDLIILESTSPVGTTEKLLEILKEKRPDLSFPGSSVEADINIAYCPERVLPGKIIEELVSNNRVVGGITNECSDKAKDLYEIFLEGKCYLTNSRTAEMVKLTENASRDVSIAFANELSIICDDENIDVWELINLSNLHPRVNILEPGPGVGGHCIAVDPWFIVSRSQKAKLIKTSREINDSKPMWVIEKIKEMVTQFCKENKANKKDICIAIYGLAFKPDIDDLRESPAVQILEKLSKFHEGQLISVEPNIELNEENKANYGLVSFFEASKKADIHVLLVKHKEFLENKVSSKYVLDIKGAWKI